MKTAVEQLKIIEELHNGELTVIAKNSFGTKEFHGSYSEEYQCVFFCIPSTYEIIGYKQD